MAKTPWVDELERANDCTTPLGLHALQLLPEMTDETVAELQQDDPVLGPVTSWLKAKYEPSLDELRELQPEGRRLWSMNISLQIVNNVLVRKTDREYQLLVPDVLKR